MNYPKILPNITKQITLLAALLIIFSACRKKPVEETTPIANPPAATPQIVHENINKEVAYNEHLSIDLNHDGVTDYTFSSVLIAANGQNYLYLTARGNSQNSSRLLLQTEPEQATGGLWAGAYAKGTLIGAAPISGSNWSTAGLYGYLLSKTPDGNGEGTYAGPLNGKQHVYLGVRLYINAKFYYGWIGLSQKPGLPRIIIEDVAYSTEADGSITAGIY